MESEYQLKATNFEKDRDVQHRPDGEVKTGSRNRNRNYLAKVCHRNRAGGIIKSLLQQRIVISRRIEEKKTKKLKAHCVDSTRTRISKRTRAR